MSDELEYEKKKGNFMVLKPPDEEYLVEYSKEALADYARENGEPENDTLNSDSPNSTRKGYRELSAEAFRFWDRVMRKRKENENDDKL